MDSGRHYRRAARQAEMAAANAQMEKKQLEAKQAKEKERMGLRAARALRARTGGGFSYNATQSTLG